MQGKAQELLDRIGGDMAESIGVRPGESTRPETKPSTKAPAVMDFIRDRSVGDIDVTKVIADPNQPRKEFDEQQLDQLAADIKTRGQLQPIRVRWHADTQKWMIISGERRWRAVQRAGLAKIKCMFLDRELSENELRTEALVENLLRSDLTPMEEAKAYRGLMELNHWRATDVASSLHISKAKVSRALQLLNLPEDIQKRVDRGELAATAAYELAKVNDSQAQRELADRAIAGQTYTETAKAARVAKGKPNSERKKPTNETLKAGEARVTVVSRKYLGDSGLLEALLDAAEQIRHRMKNGVQKAA